MDVLIYALKDPRNKEIRYIGKTINKLSVRLSKHISNAKHAKGHCQNWINKLQKLGLRPVIELIETANEANWQEREKFWIKKKKKQGAKLTNLTEGGEGNDPKLMSEIAKRAWEDPVYRGKHSGENHHMKKPENKKKVSGKNSWIKKHGHSEEAKKKISNALRGRKQSSYQKKRAAEANRKPKTEKHKKNISLAKSKYRNQEAEIFNLVDKQGKSLSETARILSMPVSAVWRIYNKKYKWQN